MPKTRSKPAVSVATKLPAWPVEPMMAKPVQAMPRDAERYAFEFKWDGYRTLLFCDGGAARVQSRNLRDVTGEFPELQAVAEALGPRHAVLDGEIVVLNANGRPDFGALQRRAGFGPAPGPKLRVAVDFIAFDLLGLDGRSLMAEPYEARREALLGLGLPREAAWVPPSAPDGESVLEASRSLGLEGVVAKRLGSRYEPGLRSGAWLKVKNVKRQEFVVGGWLPGEGGRRGRIGSLLVGTYDGGTLVYAGSVGSGFTDKTLRELQALLEPLEVEACPFAPDEEILRASRFTEPRLVAEVQYSGWTHDDHLRHPSFKGLRHDKDPKSVVREEES